MKIFSLKYKGSRDYLHGGDIFDALNDSLSKELGGRLLRITYKRLARNQLGLTLSEPSNAEFVTATGVWLTSSGIRNQFWLVETDVPVTDSYPFNEDLITHSAELDEEVICGRRANKYTLVENVIALTKKLNYELAPEVKGKWLFGQLDLPQRLPSDWNCVVITRTVAIGHAFSRNRITIDGQDFGEIRFVGGNP